ncbi:hypothetical protein T265_03468 [Opisthorchis viverrini]|uniref:Uncharacterized protein n=1 Tax=Opisthorchis viverrini TaxID=6198 RepID=A0A075A329_OPIVI|nr:hypothetical protein T265_03468 [Opisthorchis viverrini]KER29985.1 hypothetical protein T265_03468 [Opisthorchis viverrini]
MGWTLCSIQLKNTMNKRFELEFGCRKKTHRREQNSYILDKRVQMYNLLKLFIGGTLSELGSLLTHVVWPWCEAVTCCILRGRCLTLISADSRCLGLIQACDAQPIQHSSESRIPDTCSNPAHQTTSRLVRSISTPAGFQNASSAHLPRSTNHNWIPYVIQSIPPQNGQTYTALWQISSNQSLTKPVAIRLVGVNGTDVKIGSRLGLVSRGIRTSNTIQASLGCSDRGYPIHFWKESMVSNLNQS